MKTINKYLFSLISTGLKIINKQGWMQSYLIHKSEAQEIRRKYYRISCYIKLNLP